MTLFSHRLPAVVLLCALSTPALSQILPDIVVTPNRTEQSIQRSGSAVTVISGEEIAKANPGSVLDALRGQPGVFVVENGGPGKLSTISLRGAEVRHTLVLIDGIRVGDPTSTGGEFDFSTLIATDIERIEILRGPQSALYGSDAIGGVVNIITRKGRGDPRASITMEGGSYGTAAARASISGGTRDVSYALSAALARSDAFSSYGYRIAPLEARYGPLDDDGYRRVAGSGRLAWRPVEGVEVETGFFSGRNRTKYDAAFAGFGFLPDTPSDQTNWLTTVFGRVTADAFGGMLRNRVTLSGNVTERELRDVQRYDFGFGLTEERNAFAFRGERAGLEYQGDLKLGSYGLLTFGASVERENFLSKIRPGVNSFNLPERLSETRLTQSAFALHQITLFERLDLSFGARVDDVEGVKPFYTQRATAAYRIEETGTKLRASIGTGAKAPSLYQQFSIYAPTRNNDPALQPERSVGFDIGVDQSLLEGRVKLSASLFQNRIKDLIDFDFRRGLPGPFGPRGQYINVARAKITGFEGAADIVLWPDLVRMKASYTNLLAEDETTDLPLARRPRHSGRVSFLITPMPRLTIEPSVVLVGERWSRPGKRDPLEPYARFDIRMDYAVSDNLTLFARAENITDARYQEIATYGTTGRAIYGGLRATW